MHLLTVGEVAHRAGVGPDTVRRWESLGRLRALRIGPQGERLFDAAEIERFLVERKQRVQRAELSP